MPGPKDEFNSFRSELVGLLGSSLTLYTLSLSTHTPRGLIIGCDGDAALEVLSLPAETINTNLKHWDLISIIYDLWKLMDCTPVKAYVKGHQDGCDRQLTRLEHMNVLMDGLAKNTALLRPARMTLRNLGNIGIPLVSYENNVLVGQLQKALYYTLTMERHMQYLNRKLTIDHSQLAWRAFEKARNASGMVTNTFISKWLSNTVPTGKVLQLRQHSITNRCPRCNHWGEDRLHVLTCWETGAKVIWDKGMDKLKQKMQDDDTCPEIQQLILTSLTKFRQSPRNPDRYVPCHAWAAAQHEVGWENFLCGLIHKSLLARQQDYYNGIGSRKCSR
jgi:hypothetical protein